MVPAFINIADTNKFSSISNNIWSYEGDSHFNNITTHNKAYNFLLSPLINGVVSPELAKKRKLAGPETIQNVKTGSGREIKTTKTTGKTGCLA